MPVKKMRVRKKDVPYMNAEWKEAIRKKRKYAKKFSKDKNKGDLKIDNVVVWNPF